MEVEEEEAGFRAAVSGCLVVWENFEQHLEQVGFRQAKGWETWWADRKVMSKKNNIENNHNNIIINNNNKKKKNRDGGKARIREKVTK